MKYKKIALSMFFVSISTLFFFAAICFVQDPGHMFLKKGKDEKEIAQLLLKGNNVARFGNINERTLQHFYISGLPSTPAPDLVILGSSRSMGISSLFFSNGIYLVNNCVSGATLEDLVAIWQLYKKQKNIPKSILIGIDPWFFNENHGQTRWKSLEKHYADFIIESRISSGSMGKNKSSKLSDLKELVSIKYLKNAIFDIFKNDRYYAFKGYDVDSIKHTSKFKDGSIVYGSSLRTSDVRIINQRAMQYVSNSPIYSLASFSNIEEKYESLLCALLDDIKEHDSNVFLWFPPYHPIVYQRFVSDQDYKMVLEVEKYVKKIAQERGISCFGSYNPSTLSMPEFLFIDGMHIGQEGYSFVLSLFFEIFK